ncbi:CLUMA_CG020621, isoform A [Clunio marinus]|uniref:CLUMA_CG020621, isoform A n=1 Tax=Clunio marinus TaxID=568069 RepID=A0A1J1J859_9DIPT|nr:CLUMA_CG020621, isoform A [Clunio marinus]
MSGRVFEKCLDECYHSLHKNIYLHTLIIPYNELLNHFTIEADKRTIHPICSGGYVVVKSESSLRLLVHSFQR